MADKQSRTTVQADRSVGYAEFYGRLSENILLFNSLNVIFN